MSRMGGVVNRTFANTLYIGLMISTIVLVDFSFFKNHIWPRLAVNVGIVMIYGAFYYRFMKRG
jgi:hypothetical protein